MRGADCSSEAPCPAVRSRVSPRRASHLSCLPKKVDPKKGTPTSAVRLQRTALRCSDFGARAELATRPCGPLRSDSCAKSVNEGASRRAKVLRSSTPPTGPAEQHQTHLAAHRLGGRSLRCAASRITSRRRRREAQGFAAGRASAPPLLTSRGCLSAAPAGRVASSARGCKDRASQRTPRSARGDASGSPLLGHFFWRDRRSDSPAGARPGLPQQRTPLRSSNRAARTLRYLSANAGRDTSANSP